MYNLQIHKLSMNLGDKVKILDKEKNKQGIYNIHLEKYTKTI